MEPIINPWFIYFIGISENIRELASGITITSFVLFLIAFFIIGAITFIKDSDDRTILKTKKPFFITNILLLCILFISLMTNILIPERGWIIGTLVAASLTEDKIEEIWEFTTDRGGDIKDYTFEIKDTLKSDLIEMIREINEINTDSDPDSEESL